MPTFTGWAGNLGFFLKPVHGDQGKIWNRYGLLLDINLPKVNGIEVLRKIKEHDMLKKVPVLMLSITDNPKEVETCYCMGCNVYLTKPTEPEIFAQVISSLGSFLNVVTVPTVRLGLHPTLYLN